MADIQPFTLKTYVKTSLSLFVTVFVFGILIEYGIDTLKFGEAEVDWVKAVFVSGVTAIFVPWLINWWTK